MNKYFMNIIMLNDKEGIFYDYFSYNFYKQLKRRNIPYNEGQFDEFLNEMFNKNKADYKECYKVLSNIPYGFFKRNLDLITTLVRDNKSAYIKEIFDMYRYKKKLILETIPDVNHSSVVESKKELLLKLEKSLLLMKSENEDNILRQIEEKFYKKYGMYNGDPYLSDLYNEILDDIESDLKNTLIDQFDKIDRLDMSHAYQQANSHMRDTYATCSRDKHSFKDYRKR